MTAFYWEKLVVARPMILFVLLAMQWNPVYADNSSPVSWVTALEGARHCVKESKPDLERAVACYEEAMSSCLVVPEDEHKSCLEMSVQELEYLLPRYKSYFQGEASELQYSPKRCEYIYDQGINLPKDEFLVQCKFTLLVARITAGHIASLWGEFPTED
ncbi:MAG: hypothetical protein AAFT19_03870 [Pseudomonadota bacterium]